MFAAVISTENGSSIAVILLLLVILEASKSEKSESKLQSNAGKQTNQK